MVYPPVITAFYIGLCALLHLMLSLRVVQGRLKYKIGMGNGQNKDLATRIRTQANFVEYVPVLLVIMLALELLGLQPWMIHIYGAALIISRLLHAYGLHLSHGRTWPRLLGTLGTFSLLLIGAIGCFYRYIFV